MKFWIDKITHKSYDKFTMLDRSDLETIAKARIKEAEILSRKGRYDGAIYLCGYAIEIALKARICKTLNWNGYPSTRKEFEELKTFRTHNFDTLLRLSGVESEIKSDHLVDWSIVAEWEPELRYRPIGSASEEQTEDMIESSKVLLDIL